MNTVADTAKRLVEREGRTQKWIVERMNAINPELDMDQSKLSATIRGTRKMSGDEMIAFCRALEVSPDEFL